jgi:hypothetical protein
MGGDWRRWAGRSQRRERTALSPRRVRSAAEPALAFAPVVVTTEPLPGSAGLIEIRISDALIRVPECIDPHALARIIAAVRSAS